MSHDDVDLIRIARLHNDIQAFASLGAEPLTGTETMEQIEQKRVSLAERLKRFDERSNEKFDHAAKAVREKARENMRKAVAYLKAVYEADPDDVE